MKNYDSDELIDLYGFNGIIPGTTHTSRFFAMNGKIFSPDVSGVKDCIQTYKQAIQEVKWGDGTNLAQVIKHANDRESYHVVKNPWKKINLLTNKKARQSYRIMIVLTTGEIADYQESVDEIVKASTLPISFIFVGIGNGDFTSF
jgi:hypothetical protein